MTPSNWPQLALQSLQRIPSQGRYHPEIDGLRFFAIAFVLFGHLMERVERATARLHPLHDSERLFAFLIPKATTGVLLFFTISGYILGLQYLRMRTKHERFQYIPYLVRRATRIAPPYFVILLFCFFALQIMGHKPELAERGDLGLPLPTSLILSLLFIHGITLGAMPQVFPPGWSLEVEVHFYVIAPVIFAYMMPQGRSEQRWRRWAVLIGSFAFMAILTFVFERSGAYYLSLARFIPFFMLGPFLVLQLGDGGTWKPSSLRADLIGFVALAGLAVTGICQGSAVGWTAVTALDTARLIAIAGVFVGAAHGDRFQAMCSAAGVRVLGGACFSLYLCHLEVMQLLTPLIFRFSGLEYLWSYYVLSCIIQLPVIALGSIIFYKLVEQPFMNSVDIFHIFRRFAN